VRGEGRGTIEVVYLQAKGARQQRREVVTVTAVQAFLAIDVAYQQISRSNSALIGSLTVEA